MYNKEVYSYGRYNALTIATFNENGEVPHQTMLSSNNKRKALTPQSVVQTGEKQVIYPIVDKKGFGIAVFDL